MSRRIAGWLLCAWLAMALPAAAQMPDRSQMPDLSQMNGRSLPAPDAPLGQTTVRVMKQTFGNNAVGQEVTLRDAAGTTIGPRKTDENGRATFDGLSPGTSYVAVATVDGERVESQPFTQPAVGGLRVILVSGLTAAPAGGAAAPPPTVAARPATAGSVALGLSTRLIVEQADEFVEVFVLADVVNTTDGPVSLPQPIVFTPPAGALGTAVLEGVTAAALESGRIVVKGPLPPGPTSVQFGYRLPSDTGQVAIRQAFPIAGATTNVVVRQTGATAVTVAGEKQRRDTQLEGRTYVVIQTGAVDPSAPLEITVSGLPARPRWPVRVALGLAALIVIAGLIFGRARADDDGTAPAPARS